MITNNEEAWDSRDNNRNDFDNTDHTFGRQNEDAFNNSELDDDELKEDEDDNSGLEPTFDQGDLTDEDEEYDRPNEIPEEGESKKEGTGYHHQSEVDQPQRGANTSYSEQTDVTPPNKKEFPSTGPAKTDFASRPQGRTTGRMVGHEPGTEGI